MLGTAAEQKSTMRWNNVFQGDHKAQQMHDMATYLRSGRLASKIPSYANRAKFLDRSRELETDSDGGLVLKQTGQKLLFPEDIESTLAKVVREEGCPTTGVTALYKYVLQRYLVKRSDVASFLQSQPTYQMQLPDRSHKPRPILADDVGELIAIDLIDLSRLERQNKRYKYILTCVDVFSGYVWLGKLKEKTAVAVRDEYARVVDVTPRSILSDNGGEFLAEFDVWLQEHEIKHRRTATHSPQANGVAETANRRVRRQIQDQFVKYNTHNWVDALEDIALTMNNTYSGARKATPKQILGREYRPRFKTVYREGAKQYMARKRRRADANQVEVGDIVRVKMSALYSGVRANLKSTMDRKYVVVTYSPELFRVTTKKLLKGTAKYVYTVERLDDGIRPNRVLDIADLQRVGDEEANNGWMNVDSVDKALALNHAWRIPENDNMPE